MTKLRAPLKRWLDTPLDEPQLQRMWRQLQRDRREPTRARPRWAWLAVTGAALLSAAICWRLFAPGAGQGPLALEGGVQLTAGATLAGGGSHAVALGDGSQITLDDASQLEVLENNGQRFVLHLRRGRGHFDVRPGGPRRWSIECGLATVEVVGTEFSVDRSPRGVHVRVARGIVLVRGERVPDRVRRLVAGQELRVPSQPSQRESPAAEGGAIEASETARGPAAGRPESDAPQPTTGSRSEHAAVSGARSPNARASLSVEPDSRQRSGRSARVGGDAGAPASLDTLLRAADRARRTQQSERAEALLRRVMQLAPGTAYEAIAAFSLARMQLDREPARAASNLQRAIAAGTPEGLREDAMATLVEAYARSHQAALAQRAAAAYAAAYPSGRRLSEVKRWAARL